MVSHRRTYSDQSLRSVGEVEGMLFSTPDEKEWVEQGGELWVAGGGVLSVEDEGGMDVEGDERSMPHDPKLVLHHLGSNGLSFPSFLHFSLSSTENRKNTNKTQQNQEQ